jgi:drug/metabolite transporter (DMT)-like permease
MRNKGIRKSHCFILTASVGFSFILVFSTLLKQSGVPSLEQVFFRLVFATFFLFILLKGKPILPKKKDLPYFILIGLTFAVFLSSSLSAIVFDTPIAVVSGLINTQPIFTAVFAFITGKEKVTWRKAILIFVGVLGTFLVTGLSFEQIRTWQVGVGVALSIFGGFLYAVYLFLKRLGQSRYKALDLLFNTFLIAVPCTLIVGGVIAVFNNNPKITSFVFPNTYQLLLLFLFAVFSTVLPYGMLNKVDPGEVSPTTEGMILLLDPVLHAFWAILIFQQFVTPLQYLGILLVLLTAVTVPKATK